MIKDSRLANIIRRYIPDDDTMLKNIKFCGSQVLPSQILGNIVYVTANNKNSKIVGTVACHSSWACPVCTPRRMAYIGSEIACYIEALKKKKLVPFMITLTIPHNAAMHAADTFEILRNAWRLFNRPAARGKSSVGKSLGVFSEMRATLEIKRYVKVFEFTWGKHHGWHPHIHMLMWIHKDKLQRVADYEETIRDLWNHFAAIAHANWLAKKFNSLGLSPQLFQERYEDFLRNKIGAVATSSLLRRHFGIEPKKAASKSASKKNLQQYGEDAIQQLRGFITWVRQFDDLYSEKGKKRGLVISKNNDGTIRTVKSSHYVSGWSGDSELTSSQKQSPNPGHFSIYQILLNIEKAKSKEEAQKFVDLFFEYAKTTKGHRRVAFDHEAREVIDEYKKTKPYIIAFKKKVSESGGEYHPVIWFSTEQWSGISYTDLYTSAQIIPEILALALKPNPQIKIIDFLLQYGIDCRDNLNKQPFHKEATILANIREPLAYTIEEEDIA